MILQKTAISNLCQRIVSDQYYSYCATKILSYSSFFDDLHHLPYGCHLDTGTILLGAA